MNKQELNRFIDKISPTGPGGVEKIKRVLKEVLDREGEEGITEEELLEALTTKQDTLVSGTNLKTVNNTSLLGSGNIAIPKGDKGDKGDTGPQGPQGPQGLKGDTGVSADYPITIYNGLDSDATDQALAAAQGKVLDGKVSQLQQEKTNIGDSGILLQDITTAPGRVYVTADMVSPGDKLYFYLESINNLQGTLKCELEGYVHDSYIIVPAGQSAIVEYTIPENFLRIYTLSTYNPCKIVKVLTKKSNDELYKDVVDLKKEDAGLRSFINTEECIRIFLSVSGSLGNRGWTASGEYTEPTYNNSSSGWYVTAFDTIGTSAVIVSFNALVEGYAIACYEADGTFIKNIHTSELGSLEPNSRMVNLPADCAVILIKHAGSEVSCKRNKTITENDYFTGGGRIAGVIDSIKINGIKKEEVSQYFVHTIMKKYGTSGSPGSRFLIMKGSAIQCFVQLSSVLSGVQTVNLPEFSGSGVTATIKLNTDKLAVAAQSLSGLATTPSDPDWQFSYTRTNYLYLKDAAFDSYSYVDNSIWTNIHPGIIDKLPILKTKLQENADDINILMLGDSFFAAQITSPILSGIANLPPNCNRRHTQYYIWDRIVKNKPQTDRWDSSVNTFTENGAFVANGATYPTLWDVASQSYHILGKNTGVDLMKYSSSANASVAFSWNMASYEKLHFIFAKCANLGGDTNTKGTSEATVTITQGNGKAQVWNGTEWVEANGYTFSQEITQSGDGYAQVMFYVKLKFKRVTTDTVNITIANTANDGLFYYWGTERWNGNTIFITNIARGGFTSMQLQLNAINDVGDRDRDLVIFETPYTNDMASYTEVSSLNAVRWMLEGKSYDGTPQSGWLLNSCLKTISDNFSKFDVLCVVPHIGGRFINTNDTFKVKANNITFYQMTQRYKDAITRAGLSYLGIDAYFIAQAKADDIGLYESVAAGTDIFTYDDVHPNETGCIMYAKNIAPIFDLF